MKKFFKITGWSLLGLVLALLLAILFLGGPLIKHTVNAVGPKALGVPVTLQAATFAPFKGQLTLKGLHVGNPEGFKTPGLFELGLIKVDLDVASLFKKLVVIKEIRIEGPEITYERALKNSNIGQLLEQLRPATNAPAQPAAEPKTEGGKKVVIQKLTISGSRVHATITALGGHSVLLPLPPIRLTNIGGDGQEAKGVTWVEALRRILGAVFTGVTDVVTGAGGLAVDGVKAVGGAAVGGVKAVGGVAVDGVKAVGAGAGKAVDGVKNLIGLGEKKAPAKDGQ